MTTAEPLECLDRARGDCQGEVELRHPLSGTGIPYPRCDHHWDKRLKLQEEHNRRDADYRRVDWFDAGEVYEDAD